MPIVGSVASKAMTCRAASTWAKTSASNVTSFMLPKSAGSATHVTSMATEPRTVGRMVKRNVSTLTRAMVEEMQTRFAYKSQQA